MQHSARQGRSCCAFSSVLTAAAMPCMHCSTCSQHVDVICSPSPRSKARGWRGGCRLAVNRADVGHMAAAAAAVSLQGEPYQKRRSKMSTNPKNPREHLLICYYSALKQIQELLCLFTMSRRTILDLCLWYAILIEATLVLLLAIIFSNLTNFLSEIL